MVHNRKAGVENLSGDLRRIENYSGVQSAELDACIIEGTML